MRTLTRTLISGILFTSISLAQNAMFFGQNTSSASGPPSGFTATGGAIAAGGGNTYTLTSINVASNQAVFVTFGAHDTATDYCATVTGVTATGGDTLSFVGNAHFSGFACVGVYALWNPTPNATYTIVIQGVAGSPAGFVYSILQFTKGAVVGTADGTCSNSSAGATALACSAAITPTGAFGLGISSFFAYDDTGPTGTDNSTPAFTIPTNGNQPSSGIGRIILSYYAPAGAPAGSVTPGITNVGLGDPVCIWGGMFK